VAVKKHLEVRIALGMARANKGKKRYKDALAELTEYAEIYGKKSMPGMVLGSSKYKAWAARLKAAKKRLDADDANAELGRELKDFMAEIESDRTGGSYRTACRYLLGRWRVMRRKTREAVDDYIIVVEAYKKRLDGEVRSRLKAEASRPKTPDKIPSAEKPPGKLDGKYKKAVEEGLDWLARHQTKEGTWDDGRLADVCGEEPCPEGRTPAKATGLSHALAILALVRAGVSTKSPKLGPNLKRAVDNLLSLQTPAGLLAKTKWLSTLEHARFTLALAEVEISEPGLDGVKEAIEKAVKYLLAAQNPGMGWRFGIRPGDNDSTFTSFCLMALARARTAGVNFPLTALTDGLTFIDKVTDEVRGRTGAFSKGGHGAVMADARTFKAVEEPTALALAARILWSADPKEEEIVKRGFAVLWSDRPCWEKDKRIYYNYWIAYSLAYALKGGKDANHCLAGLAKMLLSKQEKKGCAKGSWPNLGAFSSQGRVLSTARAILSLLNIRGVALPVPVKPSDLIAEEKEEKKD